MTRFWNGSLVSNALFLAGLICFRICLINSDIVLANECFCCFSRTWNCPFRLKGERSGTRILAAGSQKRIRDGWHEVMTDDWKCIYMGNKLCWEDSKRKEAVRSAAAFRKFLHQQHFWRMRVWKGGYQIRKKNQNQTKQDFFFAGSCLGKSRADRPSVSQTKVLKTLWP